MDPQIKDILRKDVEERALMSKGLQRIRDRQISLVLIGIMIFFMFLLNYVKIKHQTDKQDIIMVTMVDALNQGNILINQSNKLINKQDSLLKTMIKERDINDSILKSKLASSISNNILPVANTKAIRMWPKHRP